MASKKKHKKHRTSKKRSHKEDLEHHAKTYHKKKKHTAHQSHHVPSQEEEQLISEGLKAIYGTKEETVDFTKMDRARGRFTNILLTVVVTLGVIALTAWATFFVYTKYFSPTQEQTFDIQIIAPEELVSGEETEIQIQYKNPLSVPLASLSIDTKLPAGFKIDSLNPVPDDIDELIWDVGDLSAGSDGIITIEGQWLTDVPASTPIQVFADYRPSNFNSDFQKIETTYIETFESTLVANIEGPEEARPGERLSYTITVENTGAADLGNTRVDLALPDGFFLEESDPALEAGTAPSWVIEQLLGGEETTIAFEGSFAADQSGFQYFDLEMFAEANDRSFTQTKAQAFTDVTPSNVTLGLVANGSTEAVNAELGKTLRMAISLENTGETDVEDGTLLLDFQADKPFPIIWSEAELGEGRITSDGIYWDADTLGTLVAGEKRTFNLSFPLEESIGTGQADRFSVVAEADLGGSSPIRSTPIEVAVNSRVSFDAQARYHTQTGAPLGSGPLPPTAGSETTYRVFWEIANELHDLEDVEVTATLPPHVSWKTSVSTDLGTLSFNEATRTVHWKIAQLPTSVPRVEANFAISITPDENDVGKFIKLMSGSSFRATDSETEALVQHATGSLDTELPEDEFAEGKGVVVE